MTNKTDEKEVQAMVNVGIKDGNKVQEVVNTLVENGKEALKALESYTQEQVDHIVHEMALSGLDQHMPLAKMAVEETGRGVYEDKCTKIYLRLNIFGIA
ncbi:hypothetical protein COF09_29230 [Bacillus toyonensis]|nr:hypothetical protein COF09_29230 [Bacillus toyonensis]